MLFQAQTAKPRTRWFRVNGRAKKPKYPLTPPQPVNTVIRFYKILDIAVLTSYLAEGETVRVDSSFLPVGVALESLPDSQSSFQRPSLREQVSDIRYAVRKHSAKIRRLLVEHNRLETAAEREYCENGGKLVKPHPQLFTISAELSANLRARDVLNMQLSDLLDGGSDGAASEPSVGSKTSNSVRISATYIPETS